MYEFYLKVKYEFNKILNVTDILQKSLVLI